MPDVDNETLRIAVKALHEEVERLSVQLGDANNDVNTERRIVTNMTLELHKALSERDRLREGLDQIRVERDRLRLERDAAIEEVRIANGKTGRDASLEELRRTISYLRHDLRIAEAVRDDAQAASARDLELRRHAIALLASQEKRSAAIAKADLRVLSEFAAQEIKQRDEMLAAAITPSTHSADYIAGWEKGVLESIDKLAAYYANNGELSYDKAIELLNIRLQHPPKLTPPPVPCVHPNATREAKADTGNYDPSADRYWWQYSCADCGKRWTEDQS